MAREKEETEKTNPKNNTLIWKQAQSSILEYFYIHLVAVCIELKSP